jgi:hypothetical protein
LHYAGEKRIMKQPETSYSSAQKLILID